MSLRKLFNTLNKGVDNNMESTPLEPNPPNSNPFYHDLFHMGTRLGKNCVIMHENHTTEECKYLIIVNTITGERTKVELNTK